MNGDGEMALEDATVENRYDFARPIDLKLNGDPLLQALASTPAFRRLRDVRFLGGIDYALVPNPNGAPANCRFSRYQHSLGVARLAQVFCDLTQASASLRNLATAAALLHDIGHAPLSHSLEPVFEATLGLGHHLASREIICGASKFGDEIKSILRASRLDVDEVLSVIEGEHDPFGGLFSGPINFDTMEGVLRSFRYIRPKASLPSPIDIVTAATRRQSAADSRLVDAFWRYKGEMYRDLIRSRLGVVADFLCQQAARDRATPLARRDFFVRERTIFAKLPGLKAALRACARAERLSTFKNVVIPFKARHFFVDETADFFTREDRRRYRQWKTDQTLALPTFEVLSMAAE